jgi:hypothetical protein
LPKIFANALQRQKVHREPRASFFEMRELKDRLEQENIFLREEIERHHIENLLKSVEWRV